MEGGKYFFKLNILLTTSLQKFYLDLVHSVEINPLIRALAIYINKMIFFFFFLNVFFSKFTFSLGSDYYFNKDKETEEILNYLSH